MGDSDAELDQLRQILIGQDLTENGQRVDRLTERLDDSQQRADEISRVLPQAVARSSERDKRLERALAPTVEASVAHSVRKNPKPLAEAIFPIIGPAIRKAMAHAIQSMIQSLNATLEQGLSLKALRWRIEAKRSGKPYAEIALLHSLAYRVEQLLLIHQETSAVLHHSHSPEAPTEDPYLVSSMVSAIQDFVKDAFASSSGEPFDQFQVGDVTVIMARGAQAYLAAVVRGTPPANLWNELSDVLDAVHVEYGPALAAFEGDNVAFEPVSGLLEPCLRTEVREKRTNLLVAVIPAVALLLAASWLVLRFFAAMHREELHERLIESVEGESGIEVIHSGIEGERVFIRVLRDPRADSWEQVRKRAGFDSGEIDWIEIPFVAFEGQIVENEVQGVIQEWATAFSANSDSVTGVAPEVDNPIEPPVGYRLEGGVLALTGSASGLQLYPLVTDLAKIPGIARVQTDEVMIEGADELAALGEDLLGLDTQFPCVADDVEWIPIAQKRLTEWRSVMFRLNELVSELALPRGHFQFRLSGHALAEEADRRSLAKRRREHLAEALGIANWTRLSFVFGEVPSAAGPNTTSGHAQIDVPESTRFLLRPE